MTTATLHQDRRTARAQGILAAGDIHESKPGVWRVRDTQTGSGIWHHVTSTTCDCIDFARSGLACKHLLSLRQYQAANWSSRTEPRCPTCGSATYADMFYVGGRGYCSFRICEADKYHRAVGLP